MQDYTIIVKLGEEAIFLSAKDEKHAIELAKDIIAEEYSWDLSRSVEYSVEVGA